MSGCQCCTCSPCNCAPKSVKKPLGYDVISNVSNYIGSLQNQIGDLLIKVQDAESIRSENKALRSRIIELEGKAADTEALLQRTTDRLNKLEKAEEERSGIITACDERMLHDAGIGSDRSIPMPLLPPGATHDQEDRRLV